MSYSMSSEKENLDKIVRFDEGPIEAIGLKLKKITAQSGERPADMVIRFRLNMSCLAPLGNSKAVTS
jgi:hypothetical protein